MKLTADARDTLRAHDVSQAQWIRRHFGADAKTWLGDACGCPDDQCVGYHHDEHDECSCLPALLSERVTAQPMDGRCEQ